MLENIMENTWLAVPSFLALSIQIWLIIHVDKHFLINNRAILLFFLGVLGLSSIEFSTYMGLIEKSLIFMKLFYVFISITFSGLLLLSMKFSGYKFSKTKNAESFILALCILFSLTMLFTNLIVSGIQSIGYSITRVPGDYYFIIQIYGSGLIISTIYFLARGARISDKNNRQARVLLFSTTPFLFVFLSLIVIMAFGIKVNSSIIIPLAMTYMLLVIIFIEQRENFFPILIKIPWTSERKAYKEITTLIEEFLINADNGEKESLKSLTSNIEKQIVSMAVKMTNGSQIKAASLLNVSASSICRKKIIKV